MYINKSKSKILSDGSLSFKDPDNSGISYKNPRKSNLRYIISNWDSGLKPKFFQGTSEIDGQTLPLVTLITQSHLNEIDLPVNKFIRDIPNYIAIQVKHFSILQFHILRAVAYSSAAHDLLFSNPALLLLKLLNIKNFEQWLSDKCDNELSEKQVNILSEIYRRNPCKRDVKLLRKIKFETGGIYELIALHKFFIRSHRLVTQFPHFKVLPIRLIEAIINNQRFIISPYYKNLVSSASNAALNTLMEKACDTQNKILDIHYPGMDSLKEPLSRVKSYDDLERLHDRVLNNFDRYKMRLKQKSIFIAPPLQGLPEIIEPIVNSNEMKHEGILQHNCIANYTPDNENYFYSVLVPEDRCTLHIRYSESKNKYLIQEILASRNTTPKASTVELVKNWLSECQIL